jgi:phosphate transport system protein
LENLIEPDLDAVRQKLLHMAGCAERAIQQAVQSLLHRDLDLAVLTHQEDEVIDRLEVEIDEMTIVLLSKAPLAGDLRLISVAMKMAQNLERMGDEADKIAKRARDLAREPAVGAEFDFARLAGAALAQVRAALEALTRGDSAAARALIPQDREVDRLNHEVQTAITRHMTGNPETIGRCLHWIVAAKSLERIADHAKNIAEEVVYLREAQDIRHPSSP